MEEESGLDFTMAVCGRCGRGCVFAACGRVCYMAGHAGPGAAARPGLGRFAKLGG
jgi:hypothetical protein